jgi:hypothetical protein
MVELKSVLLIKCYSFISVCLTLMIFFVILIFKTAGFSAASEATRVSVVIGVFKVCLKIFS